MEFDIDKELDQIIEKYDLDRHYPAYRTSRRAYAYLRKWVEDLSQMDTRILFITMDDSVLWMLSGWAVGENISAIQIRSVEKLDDHITKLQNVDKVYIVAYTRTIEILHWLWRNGFQAESIYDVLENQHIYCQMEFHRFFQPFIMSSELELNEDIIKEINVDGLALALYEYHYQKQRLQYSASEEDKRRLGEKLFFLAIHMRNFIEAERILNTASCSEEYEKGLQEIKTLLDKIKGMLTQKKQNHIIIYWLDALNYGDAENLEYLQEQRCHSFYFHNAYTLTANTFPTFKAMFFGVQQVDDLGYQVKRVALDDSPLLQDIKKQGYDFRLMSNYINRRLDSNDNCDYYGRQILNAPCSETFWSFTKQVIQSNQPTVYLVHALVELHSPRLSVRRNRFEKEYESTPETWQEQFDELNGQLRFYDQMIGDSPYRIYMSDHGSSGIFNRYHVCFQIYHATWKNKEIDKIFCFLDFPKIMHQLLVGGEINDTTWDREYVPIQDVDYYNHDRLKKLLVQNELDVLRPWFIAHKGVVTSEYIYFYFKTGDALFHRWQEGVYLTNVGSPASQEISELLKELRKKVGEFPKELDTDPKFNDAQNTYIVYENVKRTVLEVAKLLNDKLSGEEYADNSIVLRPGGVHTMRLCTILSEDSKKKIGGIVDRNAECKCKGLGYPIYHPADKLPSNIKAVLLSTFENLETLKYEIDKQYSDLEIIDIYQYWKNCGYAFTKNFWYGLESDKDIEFLKE